MLSNTEECDTNKPPLIIVSPSIDAELFTLNPNAGSTDAVIEPLDINDNFSTFSASAESGISNKSLPLPLNEPLNSVALIIGDSIVLETNIEPVTTTVSSIIVLAIGYERTLLIVPPMFG